jgi:hypothetical protein
LYRLGKEKKWSEAGEESDEIHDVLEGPALCIGSLSPVEGIDYFQRS